MDNKKAEAILQRLDTIVKLVGMGVCVGKKQREQIALLGSAGLAPKLIAEMLGTTSGTVSVELSKMRKASTPGKRGRRGEKASTRG